LNSTDVTCQMKTSTMTITEMLSRAMSILKP